MQPETGTGAGAVAPAAKNGLTSPKNTEKNGCGGLTDTEEEDVDGKLSDKDIKKKHKKFFESLGALRKGRRGVEKVAYYECSIDEPPAPTYFDDSSSDSSSSDAFEAFRSRKSKFPEKSSSDAYGTYSMWVTQYCERHPMLMRVPLEFIQDNFSMQGLDLIFRRKYRSLVAMLSDKPPQLLKEGMISQEDLISLYLNIHQRYVLTMDGLIRAKSKMRQGDYGFCLRELCRKTPLLPVQKAEADACLGYCMKCGNCFISGNLQCNEKGNEKKPDKGGLAFGHSFPEIFLMNFPELRILEEPERYVPRVFGYRLAGRRPDPIPESPPATSHVSDDDSKTTIGIRKVNGVDLESPSKSKRSRID